MRYVDLKVGENEYKLRLGAQQIVAVEKKMGGNVLNMFMDVENGKMPSLEDCLTLIHGSLQKFHHGMNMEKVYDLYDEYVDTEGKTYTDILPIMMDVLKASGFFRETEVKKTEEMEK